MTTIVEGIYIPVWKVQWKVDRLQTKMYIIELNYSVLVLTWVQWKYQWFVANCDKSCLLIRNIQESTIVVKNVPTYLKNTLVDILNADEKIFHRAVENCDKSSFLSVWNIAESIIVVEGIYLLGWKVQWKVDILQMKMYIIELNYSVLVLTWVQWKCYWFVANCDWFCLLVRNIQESIIVVLKELYLPIWKLHW